VRAGPSSPKTSPAVRKRRKKPMTEEERERAIRDMFENAPIDDEPVTEEELEAIKVGLEDIAAGRYVIWDPDKERRR